MNLPLTYFLVSTLKIIFVVSEMGPPGEIKFYYVRECDPVLNNLEFQAKLQTASDDTDSFSMSFKIPIDYNNDNSWVTVTADKLNGDEWEKNVYVFNDKELFASTNNFLGKVWLELRTQIEPKIEDSNEILAGSYKLEGFTAMSTDLSIAQVPYGRHLITGTLTVNDEEVLCLQVEAESFKPVVA